MRRGRVAVLCCALAAFACGDQRAALPDAGGEPDASPPDAGAPDASAPDAAAATCHTSRNPTGEFAVTAIRSRTEEQPGDTWKAVIAAHEAGVRYIEIDVRLSADGVLIPARVDRLEDFTSCTGSLRETTAADLGNCSYNQDPTIAVLPLTEGLIDVDFAGVYLDLKFTDDDLAAEIDPSLAAVAAVRGALPSPDAVVAMTYRPAFASAFVAAGVRTGWKGYPDQAGAAAFVAVGHDLGVEMVCVEASALDAAVLDDSAAVGIWQLPWEYPSRTDQALLNLLFSHGAGGLITDRVADLTPLVPPPCGIPSAR